MAEHDARPAVEPLLTACAMALAEWSGERHLLLDLESHGREPLPDLELDLSRTLGWFTSLYPVSLELRARCLLSVIWTPENIVTELGVDGAYEFAAGTVLRGGAARRAPR